MSERLELLKKLCGIFGPSGCEMEVRNNIREIISPYCDDISESRTGGLIAHISGNGSSEHKLMFSAHMDEVGFMITEIDDSGYLKFGCVGGIDPRVICGRRVIVRGRDPETHELEYYKGIVGSKPIHLQSPAEASEATPVDRMYIDIGALNREDAEKRISVGDFATFDSEFVLFGQDSRMLKSKAIDDRLGCAVMINVLKRIKEDKFTPDMDVYFAFTTREEIGVSGAKAAAYIIDPDYAVVLESTAVADIDGVPSEGRVGDTGKGGALSLMDNGTIYNTEFLKKILDISAKGDVPCQVKRYVSGGNDAKYINVSRCGVKTAALSAPSRYIHTASNVIRVCDFYSICELAYLIVKGLE